MFARGLVCREFFALARLHLLIGLRVGQSDHYDIGRKCRIQPRQLQRHMQKSRPRVRAFGARTLTFGLAELVDLRWEQIDLEHAVLHVRRVKQGSPATHPLTGITGPWPATA